MSIKINLLGSPFIEINGRRSVFSLKKAEAMVYYLAVEKTVSRDKLAFLFWGDKDEASANNNLRNAICFIKNKLPQGFIHSDRSEISLGDFSSDISDITNIKTCDLEKSCVFLENLTLTNCPEFEEWVQIRREQLKNKIASTLRDRIAASYDSKDIYAVTEALELLIGIEPYDEDSVLELAEIYFKQGERVKGHFIYNEYKRYLKSEMGLKPSLRAEEILGRLLLSCGDNVMESPELCFYGRMAEQKTIIETIENNPSKNIVFLIEGEPGIGKTSLINRMLHILNPGGDPVFSTISYEAGHDYPYSAWNNLVTKAGLLCDTEKTDGIELHLLTLAGVFPNFMSNKNLNYNADFMKTMSIRTPYDIARSISSIIAEITKGKRTILTADNLQWFDAQSLSLLEAYLTNNVSPFIFFITTRPEKREYALRMLRQLEDANTFSLVHIQLKPFDKQETFLFCRKFLNGGQLERVKEDLFRESEGLPLLVVELIRALSANLEMEQVKGGLGALILARFGDISERHRHFMRVLSVFTGGAEVSAIMRVMDTDSTSIGIIAEELMQKRLIKEVEDIDGKLLVDFTHSKVKECVYSTIPGFNKKEYNRKIADIYSGSYSPQKWDPALSSMICYHYGRADLPAKVLKQHLKEMIFDIILNHDLYPLMEDDVLLSCKLPFSDSTKTEEKMNEMSHLLNVLSHGADADSDDVLHMEATYLELRGGYMVSRGEYREGRILINRALQIAREKSFHEAYIYCLQHMGHYYLQTDNGDALLACAREMLLVARREKRDKFIGIALRFIGIAFQIAGDFVKSEKVLNRSIEVFEELALVNRRYTVSLLAAKCYIGENHYWQGHFAEAMNYFKFCVEECEKKGLFWGCSHFHAHIANAAFDTGDFGLMDYHLHKGVELFEKSQGGICGSPLYALKAIADARHGLYEDSQRALEIGERLNAINKQSWTAVLLMAKAYLAEMKEKGDIPNYYFDKFINKPALEYAAGAAEKCRLLRNYHRYNALAEHFNLNLPKIARQNYKLAADSAAITAGSPPAGR